MSTEYDGIEQDRFARVAASYGDHAKRDTYGFETHGRIEPDYEGRHRRDKIHTWYTGLVIWNFATKLWDRVKIVDRHEPSMARYRTMSYPIDEDDETEWRQRAKA